jgi:uncharacterized protein
MLTTVLAILFFSLLFAGMAIGVILANKPVKGSCGGLGASGDCGLCGKSGKCRKDEDEDDESAEAIAISDRTDSRA